MGNRPELEAVRAQRDEYRSQRDELSSALARAESELDELAARIARAEALHGLSEDGSWCNECTKNSPCPTNSALRSDDTAATDSRPLVHRVELSQGADGSLTPRDMSAVETARITITRTLLDNGDDVIDTRFDGDAEHALTALGMLAMAHDEVLHPPQEDDDEDSL